MDKQSGEEEYFLLPVFFFLIEIYNCFSWRIFYGIQERDLFDTYPYILSVFLNLSSSSSVAFFILCTTVSSQATQICKHNYGYTICFTVVTWKSRFLFFVILSSLHLIIYN